MINNFVTSLKKHWYAYLAFIILNLIKLFNLTPLSHYKHQSVEYEVHFFSLWLGSWLLSGILIFFAVLNFKNKNKFYWIISIMAGIMALYYLVFPIYGYFQIKKLDRELVILQHELNRIKKNK